MPGVEPWPAVAALPRDARAHLDAFAAAFDEVTPEQYSLLTVAPERDGGPDPLERSVLNRLGGPTRAGVESAVVAFQRQAEVNLSRRFAAGYRWALEPTTVPFGIDDRILFMASLRRAVIAIALWDQLSDEERTSLLGMWDRVAIDAGLEA